MTAQPRVRSWHALAAGPSAVDPDSGERFPGGYSFDPYIGPSLKGD